MESIKILSSDLSVSSHDPQPASDDWQPVTSNNDLSAPQLSNSFVKLNDRNINYNLRNIETDQALPRPCRNFLKRSYKYSGAMLWNNLSYEAKTAQSLSDFKHKLASSLSMPSTGSH